VDNQAICVRRQDRSSPIVADEIHGSAELPLDAHALASAQGGLEPKA
jgi:hypothetical protein